MRPISAFLVFVCLAVAAPSRVNEPLEEYRRVRSLAGSVSVEGSPTVCALLTGLRRALRDMYPGYSMAITATGSSGAPVALLEGRCDLAAMSRPMTEEEIASFRARFGYEPERYTIAGDALVVLANAHNPLVASEEPPIPGLTLRQLDSIFGVERRRGGERVARWGELGLGGAWADRTIRMNAVGSTSGVTVGFWSRVLKGGKFRSTVVVQPGPGAVVSAVGAHDEALGIVSLEYRSKRTRPVPLAESAAGPFTLPTIESCREGRYPLVIDLDLYVNRKPGTPLPDLVRETLLYICSEDGQNVVVADGLVPIDLETSTRNLARARAAE